MGINFKKDIKPITEFRNKAKEILDQANRTKRPVIITQRGKGAAVLIDIEEYQRGKERVELLEAIAKGKIDLEKGDTVSHSKAMMELERCLKE